MIEDGTRLRLIRDENGLSVFASYRRQGDVLALVHVEADPALRGSGAAGRLMQDIVQHARENHLQLAPYCAYARAWFARHPEAADALAPVSPGAGRTAKTVDGHEGV